MHIIAILNRRGGAGKTATAHAFAAGLQRRGYSVLIVDLDSQGNLTFDTGAAEGGLTAFDVLTGRAKIADAIQHTASGDIVPGSPQLAAADLVITEAGKEYRLKEALKETAAAYDYCVIDTPPALGILTTNALTAADRAIIPAQAEIHSLQGIRLLRDTVAAVRRKANPALRIDGILLTRYKGRAILSQNMRRSLEAAAAHLQTKVYAQPIRECISIPEAQARQKDIFSYAPRSKAAADYSDFVNEFLNGGKDNG